MNDLQAIPAGSVELQSFEKAHRNVLAVPMSVSGGTHVVIELFDKAAGFNADKYVTLPKGKAEKLALSMTATEPLLAPVTKGQPVGTVKVALEGATVGEFPLVALADVPAANVLGRAWDTIRLWFK